MHFKVQAIVGHTHVVELFEDRMVAVGQHIPAPRGLIPAK